MEDVKLVMIVNVKAQKMNKEKRKQYLKMRKKGLVQQRENLRGQIAEIDLEISYMKGHYDLSWEERYE